MSVKLAHRTDMPALREIDVGNMKMDLGSDHHYAIDDNPDEVAEHILQSRKTDLLMLLGDICLTNNGEDASAFISRLLLRLSPEFETILFTPGNHDLRGRDKPWDTINYPGNVVHPPENAPVIACVRDSRILLANLFYDPSFIDPSVVGMDLASILKQYKGDPDGRSFLGGRLDSFPAMTIKAARALTPDISAVATHVVPDMSLVTFRVAEMTDQVRELEARLGIPFVCDPEEDYRQGLKWNDPQKGDVAAAFREWWNGKSIVMGSNLLRNPEANPRDGLTVVYGHNHRSRDTIDKINGRNFHLISHQPSYNEK